MIRTHVSLMEIPVNFTHGPGLRPGAGSGKGKGRFPWLCSEDFFQGLARLMQQKQN